VNGADDGQLLRRVERRSLALAAIATGAALVVPGGGVPMAAGVLGGALLSVLSYAAIKRGVGGLADRTVVRATRQPPSEVVPGPESPAGRTEGRAPRGLAMFVFRHALLAGMAYVMIARLRLPPVALLGGASVIVLAAAAELLRPRPH